MNTQNISKTFDLLEDLAKKGVIRVTINRPPPEHASCTLPGIYALVPYKSKGFPCDALWRTVDNHGGHSCGNGLGQTQDKKYYWAQSQVKESFHTGEYIWTGQETNNYRQWYSEEIVNQLLDIKRS